MRADHPRVFAHTLDKSLYVRFADMGHAGRPCQDLRPNQVQAIQEIQISTAQTQQYYEPDRYLQYGE